MPLTAPGVVPIVPAMACQICRAEDAAPFAEKGGCKLFRCGVCGFVFMDPLPDAVTVGELYDDAYGGAESGYFAKVDKKLKRARRQLRWLGRLVPSGRFLDAGCNGGFVAEAARQAGYEASGVDPDPVSIAYAREHYPGIDFHQGTVEDYTAIAPFDLVYCSEVIEHAPDVNRFVAALAALMHPGAILYMTTPDISHWRRPRNVLDWDAFCPPAHCVYFSPGNLATLLARHGIEIVKRRWNAKPGIKLIARKR
jgi:SAM-dependent methyltransferase